MGSDPGELAVEGAATSKQSGHGFRKWDLNVRSLRAGQAAESCVRVQSTPQVRTEVFFKLKKKKKKKRREKKINHVQIGLPQTDICVYIFFFEVYSI